ncbi:glycosyltransferase [Methylobacillus flagellatus]|uniref:glycosyltransferase n=1 Tax=Methylobacillus flagellatus TaxID=405 RepID=UPI002853EF2F|nr:glycosyltransferase [Methylobacillus flagellatus]MDR5172644.1 glycosyltransferase [Methylobacillus flagellatus]
MKILFLSHTAAGGEFVVGSHQLSKQFTSQGHEVVHLSPPVTPAHLTLLQKTPFERVRFQRWLKSGDVINQVTDIIPFSLMPWGIATRLGSGSDIFGFFLKFSALRQLRKYKFSNPDVVLIDEPRLGYLLQYFSKAKIVYRPTDIYHEIRNDPSIIEAEKLLIPQVHGFIATSEPVRQHLNRLGVEDVLLLQNGVDLDHYLNFVQSELDLPPEPRAIYAGALDHRFGFDVVRSAALQHQGISFLLAGPVEEKYKTAFNDLANVHFLGHIKYAELPNLLSQCQIGLLPMSDHPSNLGRSPMKLFEYAAVGLPVVSTATPELERRQLPFVFLAKNAQRFTENLQEVFNADIQLMSQQAKQSAMNESWASKTITILNYIYSK